MCVWMEGWLCVAREAWVDVGVSVCVRMDGWMEFVCRRACECRAHHMLLWRVLMRPCITVLMCPDRQHSGRSNPMFVRV